MKKGRRDTKKKKSRESQVRWQWSAEAYTHNYLFTTFLFSLKNVSILPKVAVSKWSIENLIYIFKYFEK